MAKLKRDIFLYMEPRGDGSGFANCRTCMMWTGPKGKTCTIHGKRSITGKHSCGLYVEGKPMPDHAGEEMNLVTPAISGLVRREVRCQNCTFFKADEGICKFYRRLNSTLSAVFALDEKVKPRACCNANSP